MHNESKPVDFNSRTTNTQEIMSDTMDVSEGDVKEALQLLKQKRDTEKENLTLRNENRAKIEALQRFLNLNKDDDVDFVSLVFKNTLIHARVYSVVWGGTKDVCLLDMGCNNPRQNIRMFGRLFVGVGESDGRDRSSFVKSERHSKTFYLSTFYVCPFCGDAHRNKGDYHRDTKAEEIIDMVGNSFYSVEELDDRLSKTNPSDFKSYPAKLKRCRSHKTMSKKEFLSMFMEGRRPYKSDESDRHREVYDLLYPAPVKFSKRYYAEKRVKKVSRKRTLTRSEVEFFSMMLGASQLQTLTKPKP